MSIFSFILILVFILLIIISFGVYFKILLRYQKIKTESTALEHFTKHYQGFQLFYNDFKDSSLFHQSVLFVIVSKDILFSLITTTLFEYPLVQALLTLMLSLLMVAYYLIKRPFRSAFEAAQQVIYEIIILIVTINIMILAVLDDDNSMDVTARNNTSKVIIVLNFCFNFLAFLFLLAKIGEVLLDAYKNYKKAKTRIKTIKIETLNESTISNLNNDSPILSYISRRNRNLFHQDIKQKNVLNEDLSFSNSKEEDLEEIPMNTFKRTIEAQSSFTNHNHFDTENVFHSHSKSTNLIKPERVKIKNVSPATVINTQVIARSFPSFKYTSPMVQEKEKKSTEKNKNWN